MMHNASRANLHDAFAAQFEPDGDGYLYREGRKGAPVRVSAAERDAFVAAFDRCMRWAERGLLVASMMAFGLFMLLSTGSGLPWRWLYGIAGAAGVTFLLFHYWSRSAPARALERRPALGNPRTKAEMDRVVLTSLSWSMVAMGCGGAIVLIVVSLTERDPAAWHPYGIAAGVALLALLIVQGIRKARL